MAAPNEDEELLQLLMSKRALGLLPSATKQGAREGKLYSETLPTAITAQGVDIYKKTELPKVYKKAKERGFESLAYDIGTNLGAKGENIPKAAVMSGYTVAGKEGAKAVGDEFKKHSLEDWKSIGKEAVELGEGLVGKAKRIGSETLSKGGYLLNVPGALTRNALMAASDENAKFEPGKILAGRGEDVAGYEAGQFRDWANTSKGVVPGIYEGIGKVGEVGLGALAMPVTTVYQAATSDKPVDFKEAWKDASKWGGDTAVDIFSDPTNAISFGGGTAVKNLEKQGAKMASEIGLKGAAAKALSKDFTTYVAKEALGKEGAGRAAMAFAKSQGVPTKVFEKVAGKGGEFIGERGLRVLGMDVGNMEAKSLAANMRRAIADKFGLDIWKLNANDRKALLHSISKMKDATDAEVEKRIAESFAGKSEAAQAAIVGNKKKLKEYGEGWVTNQVRDPDKALKAVMNRGKQMGLEGDALEEFAAANLKEFSTNSSYLNRQLGAKARTKADQLARMAEQGLISPEELGAMQSELGKRMKGAKPLISSGNKFVQGGIDVGGKVHKAATDLAREGMFGSAAYHLQNIKDDILLGIAKGGETLRGWNISRKLRKAGNDAAIVIKSDLGESISKKQLWGEALEEGVLEAGDRLIEGGLTGDKISRMVAGKSQENLAQKVGRYSNLGLSGPGKKLAQKWDNAHRLALFAEFRARGLNPKAAAQHVNDIAFNYKDPGEFPGLLKIAKAFDPFIGWGYRAATRVPAAIIGNPIRAKAFPTALRNMSSEAEFKSDKVPEYLRKETIVQLPESAKGPLNTFLNMVQAEPLQKGEGLKMTARNPTTGALNAIGETLTGDKIASGPVPRLLGAVLKDKDAYGRETSVGREALKMAAGRYIPQAADVLSAYKGTVDPFSKRGESTTPKRDAVFRSLRSVLGETIIPTSPKVEAQELMYNDDQKARLEKLISSPGATKGKMSRELYLRKLILEGKL